MDVCNKYLHFYLKHHGEGHDPLIDGGVKLNYIVSRFNTMHDSDRPTERIVVALRRAVKLGR